MAYDHQTLEQKWQKYWEENKTFRTENPVPSSPPEKGELEGVTQKRILNSVTPPCLPFSGEEPSQKKPKKYILDMFPYPSGAGLHVGHPKGYTATDIVSRYYHAKGYNVLHPMGFDAFGLPAENYAVKTGTHPRITTEANIATFTSQMKALGFSYDWDRMVDTTDPGYYQWTQWIFLELFKRGLAYEAEMPVNWCPALRAVLANEEVVDGKSEIGGHPVEKKLLRQWVLRITEYADRLITDLDGLDWPLGIKEMQRNWIGKSEGCEFRMMKDMKKSPNGGQKNNEIYLSEGVGLNCPAKTSLFESSIFETLPKVKRKSESLREIDVTIENQDKHITLRSKDIFKHFSSKNPREFYRRKQFLGCIYSALDQVHFSENIGYCIIEGLIVKVIIGEQSNGNYFVKTYYVADKLTEAYRAYLEENKKPTVLILHGWEGKPDSNWFMSTKETLEQIGYEVIVPDLPNSNTPNIEEQLTFLGQFLSRIDERSIIIGHSLGGQLATKFVELLDKKIKALVLVAPTYPGVAENMGIATRPSQNQNEIAFSQYVSEEASFSQVSKNTKKVSIHLSKNDPYISYEQAKKYYGNIADIEIREYKDKGHFNESDGIIDFPELLESFDHIRVYTTRVDTVYSMAFAVLAPDHPRVRDFITMEQSEVCREYIDASKGKSDQDRTNAGKEKTGVFTGSYVINPYNGESVPLWIADFVLGTYGTGAVFGDAHDERDFEFAKKYNIQLKYSIAEKIGETLENFVPRIGVGALVMNTLGEILIQSQTHPRGDMYSLPGGGVEEGESIVEALDREIREETGYTDFEIQDCIGAFEYNYFSPERGVNRKLTEYTYRVVLRSQEKKEPELTDRELGLNLKNVWTNKEEVYKKLIQTRDFCGYPEERILRRYFENTAFCEEGVLVSSGEYDGLTSSDARRVLAEKAEKEGFGKKKVNYKLRDWLFSRQRYWGEPIPLIHISNEDYAKLPRIEDTKKSAISYSHGGEGVTRNGDTATKALSDMSIFVDIKEVKKKDKNIEFSEIDVFTKTEKGVIRFIGSDIEKHFSSKNRHELSLRKRLRFSVVQALDSLVYENHECGYFEFRGKIVRVVLKEIGPENFIVKTYYVVGKLTDQYDEFLRTARIVSRHETETLFIGNKEFSQIYDGLTGKLIIDSSLPLLLPEVEKYEPSGDGQSPLATVPEWVNVRLASNLVGKRETNTMPQWGGSCWYYLRYMDSKNQQVLASREAMDYWQNVDEYVGGAEHAVLHLLYARFWHKVLYDIGVVPTLEPFQKLTNVGMILAYAYERADGGLVAVDLVEEVSPPVKGGGEAGGFFESNFIETSTGLPVKQVVAKMSKSLKNVVNPTDIVEEYGADTLRLYEMSMGAFTDTAPWNTEAIIGVKRFLDKAYSAYTAEVKSEKGKVKSSETDSGDMKKMKLLHKTIKKVGEDIVEYKFNTAISSLMILLNEGVPVDEEFAQEWKEKFLILLHPFAPHMAEELYEKLSGGSYQVSDMNNDSSLPTANCQLPTERSVYFAPWPNYDDYMLVDDEVTIAVQVNGKLRGTLTCLNGVMQEEVSSLAHEDPNIFKWVEGKTLVKEIFIPNKMLSIVVKD